MLYLLYIFMGLTLVSLLVGLVYFGRSNSSVMSNKMMQLRVIFQAVTILILIALLMRG